MALLTRRFGVQCFELVEDSVQYALTQALAKWQDDNIPDSPSAWLYRVAARQLISTLRADKRHQELLERRCASAIEKGYGNEKGDGNNEGNSLAESGHSESGDDSDEVAFSGELTDSLLRMLFITCHPSLPVESQLVFTLKSLCGFNIREIAHRLFITEANVYKRFARAKKFLKSQSIDMETLSAQEVSVRLPLVHRILYLVFTEGYLSSDIDIAIRQDLCDEATRLALLLTKSLLGDTPDSHALLALMYLNLARISARQEQQGLLLLEQQNRNLWDKDLIATGIACLQHSAQGDDISRYHIEAGIAAEHCLSASFEQTPWHKIAASYQLLERIAPSPLHRLNRAIATAEYQGAEAALALLMATDAPSWLVRTYHWYAVLADLQRRCGDVLSAKENANKAIALVPNSKIKSLLSQRLCLKT